MTNDNEALGMLAPKWFWAAGILYLLWSLIGCSMYLTEHMLGEAAYIDAFGADMWALKDITPAWATAGYAIGVWCGLAGIILLLLRKKLCLPFFLASLAGAIIGFLPSLFDERFRSVMAGGDYGMLVFVWVVCAFGVWFARKFIAQGVLK